MVRGSHIHSAYHDSGHAEGHKQVVEARHVKKKTDANRDTGTM